MNKELEFLWAQILSELETVTNLASYEVWLKTLEPLELFENTLILATPTQMSKDILNTKYLSHIEEALSKINPRLSNIKIITIEESKEYVNSQIIPKSEAAALEFEIEPTPMFNEKYTFDGFVVGKSNQFVHAAARAVCENPGKVYNPLFIYGGVGLGKTHIMHAIGNYLLENRRNLKLIYITSERFVNELIDSIRDGSGRGKDSATRLFRKKYRNVDVLMIDDIQFIENKQGTQEEFFHTFNDLYQAGKQIIVSSDRPPKQLNNMQERLVSRFSWGLIADIQPPEMETRLAILKKKAETEKYSVEDKVFSFIAQKIETNVREMEGLLSRVTFFAELKGERPVSLETAKEALKDYIENQKETVTAERVLDAVCEYYGISKEEICGKKKNKEIVVPRQICIYLITEILSLPLSAIGQLFGGRDHTTVMHARDKILKEVKEDSNTASVVKDIKDRLLKR
ncbi:MAG: chromosomal replication initiator protein DnaA [Firmicutes bacterium]|nr:chromosomal replication initiator protein DnaA [Bacillota bacterium]